MSLQQKWCPDDENLYRFAGLAIRAVAGELTVTIPGNYKVARPVNLRGEPAGDTIEILSGKLSLKLPAYAPASFLLE